MACGKHYFCESVCDTRGDLTFIAFQNSRRNCSDCKYDAEQDRPPPNGSKDLASALAGSGVPLFAGRAPWNGGGHDAAERHRRYERDLWEKLARGETITEQEMDKL
jgi:hypothetical protein